MIRLRHVAPLLVPPLAHYSWFSLHQKVGISCNCFFFLSPVNHRDPGASRRDLHSEISKVVCPVCSKVITGSALIVIVRARPWRLHRLKVLSVVHLDRRHTVPALSILPLTSLWSLRFRFCRGLCRQLQPSLVSSKSRRCPQTLSLLSSLRVKLL